MRIVHREKLLRDIVDGLEEFANDGKADLCCLEVALYRGDEAETRFVTCDAIYALQQICADKPIDFDGYDWSDATRAEVHRC